MKIREKQLEDQSRCFSVLLTGATKGENRENKGDISKKEWKKIASGRVGVFIC